MEKENFILMSDLMFELPYLKIDLLVKKGIAHRETASAYLKKLEQDGLLTSYKAGKSIFLSTIG
jgi:Fic family protein